MPFPISFKRRSNSLDFTRKMRYIAFQPLRKSIVSLLSDFSYVPIAGSWKNRKLASFAESSLDPSQGALGFPKIPQPQGICCSFRTKLAEDSTRIQIQPVIPHFNFF